MADQFESSRPHSTHGSSYMEEKKKKEIDTQNAHSEELFMISQMLLTLTRLNHGSCDRSAGISHPNRCQMLNKHQCHEQNRSLKLDEQECLNTSTLQERDEEYKCITSTITKHFLLVQSAGTLTCVGDSSKGQALSIFDRYSSTFVILFQDGHCFRTRMSEQFHLHSSLTSYPSAHHSLC